MSKKINEVFSEDYPQLAEQLEELSVTDTAKLLKRFKSNGKYLNEVLDYDLKDNEKIRSIVENTEKRTPLEIAVYLILFAVAFYIWGFYIY